jgi:hypothetical protein
MERKYFSLELKDADDGTGEFSAVIATLDVVDKDNDVTLRGAFPQGKEVLVSAYGHASWGGILPVGRATIAERGKKAKAEGQFWLNTTIGNDTYNTVKNAGSLQEWSYGFEVKEFSFGEHEGQKVRFIKSVNPFQISPVLVGAGEGTRTLSIKSHLSYSEHLAQVLGDVRTFTERTKERMDVLESQGRALSSDSRGRLDELVEELAEVAGHLQALLKDGAPEPVSEADAVSEEDLKARRLFAEYQRLRAAMNGISV